MNDETIIEIASQLGLAADRVFTIFVDAQQLSAIIGLVIVIFMVLCVVFTYKYLNKIIEDKYDKDFAVLMSTILLSLVYVILGFIIYDMLLSIFLPEYMAARELIHLLTP